MKHITYSKVRLAAWVSAVAALGTVGLAGWKASAVDALGAGAPGDSVLAAAAAAAGDDAPRLEKKPAIPQSSGQAAVDNVFPPADPSALALDVSPVAIESVGIAFTDYDETMPGGSSGQATSLSAPTVYFDAPPTHEVLARQMELLEALQREVQGLRTDLQLERGRRQGGGDADDSAPEYTVSIVRPKSDDPNVRFHPNAIGVVTDDSTLSGETYRIVESAASGDPAVAVAGKDLEVSSDSASRRGRGQVENEMKALLHEEMDLLKEQIAHAERGFHEGAASRDDVLRLRRELIGVRLKVLELERGKSDLLDVYVPDE